ncbi:MAG: hypothetical protein J7K83_02020 [Candidatus Aenigmarchaeota archaeon]|nr:hypothetical protein [Candidatus Aenigmarchaeota archaeon]
MKGYPWYEIVEGEELLQGDIIESCPIIIPPSTIGDGSGSIDVDVIEYDVIIMSQSCDLINKKLELVLVCPVWPLSEFESRNPPYKSPKMKESLRRGYLPGYHLLNKCEIDGFNKEFLVVDFRSVYSVPFDFLMELAKKRGKRLRLLPPYREHLSQAFARFFMRVGLPVDIPTFR